MNGQIVIHEHAFAKLNICLDVTGLMEDGYHSVKTIMQSVCFGDDVSITVNREGGIYAKSNIRFIPNGDKNVAVRACQLFRAETGSGPEHAVIDINKHIPVCGGLGGSSTDGAAVLRALNREYNTSLSFDDLRLLAAKLGSDVPFCVQGGTVLAEGRGEILTEIAPIPPCAVVICKSEFSCSTPELFSIIDKLKIKVRPDINGLVTAIESGNLTDIGRRMFNVFESALSKSQSIAINATKGMLLDLGSLGASMSGAGSAVYGIFSDNETAKAAVRILRERGIESYLTCTMSQIPDI